MGFLPQNVYYGDLDASQHVHASMRMYYVFPEPYFTEALFYFHV